MLFELSKDEEQLYITQKHWFVLFLELAPLVLAYIVLLFALVAYAPAYVGGSPTENQSFIIFAVAFVSFFFWLWGWVVWIDYYLDVWVITTKRVIHFNQRALFNRDVKEVWFDRVQDVTVRVEGFIPSLLRYGSVRVQTASETQGVFLKHIPEAVKVQGIILHNLARYQGTARAPHPEEGSV